MTIGQIIGVIVVGIIFGLFYIILRAFVIYSVCKDLPEKEQEELLEEFNKQEWKTII